jgi:ferrochelatase
MVEDVVRDLASRGVRRFLAFPLYPHYSLTTTKGALERSRSAVRKLADGAAFHELGSWPTHPGFAASHAEAILEEIARFPDPRPESVHLLYSAHSIPKKLVTREGDPYPREVEASIAAINSALGNRSPWSLAYQSKLGPVEWLGPPTLDAIHVETLYEIDQLFGEEARQAGIEHFRRTPGLNDRPTFLAALADIASSDEEFWR